jgi:hypothetical protein
MTMPSKEHKHDKNKYKKIGNIGEAKILCKFVELGIPVYIPFGDNEKADLIADFNGRLNKIQIKTSQKSTNGKSVFHLETSFTHRRKGVRHKYTPSEIDYFACYNLDRDCIYLIKINKPITSISIRYAKAKNNQLNNVNLEKKYLIENVLCVETLHDVPKSLEDKVKTKSRLQ